MKQFFERLLTPSVSTENEIQHWRERIIAVALIGAVLLGTGAYAVNLVLTIQQQAWVLTIIYTIAYIGIVIVSLNRKLHYNLRAGTMLLILYLLGVVSALQFGSAGDARIWLIGFSILAGIFIGTRVGIAASVFSTITLLGLGFLMNLGWIAPPTPTDITNPENFSSWLSTSLPFFALGTLTVLSLGVMINGLNQSLQKGRQLTLDLEGDREHLQRRTNELERREVQVRTASEISRIISAELDLEKLFQQIVALIKERFNLYYVGVFINDDQGLYAELKAGTGESGQQMLAAGHKLAIGGTSMVGWAISRRKARIVLDVGQEAVRFNNPYLPETRSEIALPMISTNQVIGAISVQSDESEAFDQDDILVLQGVADGLATAIENARLFQQSQTNLQEIQKLHQQYLGEAWTKVASREKDLSYTYENRSVSIESESTEQSSILEKPLVLRDQVIGTISLEGAGSTWSEEDHAFIEAVISQASLSLENIRLIEESRRTAHHDRALADITSQVWATSDVDRILETTLRELGLTLQASDALIQMDATKENNSSKNE